MKLNITKRFYTTKIMTLVHRPQTYNHGYPYEFMNKMSKKEVGVYLNEVRKQLKEEQIPSNNIGTYNKVFKEFLKEREELYQIFKKNTECNTCNDTLFCNSVEEVNCHMKK